SLRTRVRISPDAFADVAQPGRRAAPRTLLLEVQILSSALIAGMAQCGGRGGLKNRKLWVRIPLPALNFVGVAQNGRARARHARGWEFKPPRPLQGCYLIFGAAGRVDSGAWSQPTSGRFDSGAVLGIFAEVAQSVDARSLNLRTL